MTAPAPVDFPGAVGQCVRPPGTASGREVFPGQRAAQERVPGPLQHLVGAESVNGYHRDFSAHPLTAGADISTGLPENDWTACLHSCL